MKEERATITVYCGHRTFGNQRANASRLCLDLYGEDRNVYLESKKIDRLLIESLDNRLRDLLDIAAYVYAADQMVSRGGDVLTSIESRWRRSFDFDIAVRCLDFWEGAEVLEALQSCLWFMMEDDIQFTFRKLEKSHASQTCLDFGTFDGLQVIPDTVALFSGGLDSLAGAISLLSGGTGKVALVSHWANPKIAKKQNDLIEALTTDDWVRRFAHLQINCHKDSKLEKESTQRSRSFLFGSIAFTVAQSFGINQIIFFENGVTSINIPISEQLLGSMASRTTHPKTLWLLSRFFSLVADNTFEVKNPFIWFTKKEVVDIIGKNGFGNLIPQSVSCAKTRNMTLDYTHCGECSQCIDRGFALRAGKYASLEDWSKYKTDFMTGEIQSAEGKTLSEAIVRTATIINRLSEAQFFLRYVELVRCLTYLGIKKRDAALKIYQLFTRHAGFIVEVHSQVLHEYHNEILSGKFPKESMLLYALPSDYRKMTVMVKSESSGSRFIRCGDYWRVQFGSHETIVKHSKGMEYIASLLRYPHLEITSREIEAGYAVIEEAIQRVVDGSDSQIRPEPVFMIDQKTVNNCKGQLETLNQQIKKAEEEENEDLINSLMREKEQIEAYLNPALAIGGGKRKADDQLEKSRKRTSKAIREAIRNIEKYDASCALHLQQSIQFGGRLTYSPETLPEWTLESE